MASKLQKPPGEVLPEKIHNIWNSIELRVLVLLSIFFQILLMATGNRRKYNRRKSVLLIVWLSYLLADTVATLALGLITQQDSNGDPNYELRAFWVPFLLMHLGGPDTITAYALADNELWPRHLLTLIAQVSISIYAFLVASTTTPIYIFWGLLVFLAGIAKSGERSLALFLASRDQFRDSLASDPDPGPSYAKFMEELVLREQEEGYSVHIFHTDSDQQAVHSVSGQAEIVQLDDQTVHSVSEIVQAADHPVPDSSSSDHSVPVPDSFSSVKMNDEFILRNAFKFFKTFKRLFADLYPSIQDKEKSSSFFKAMSWEIAFSIIEIELGLVYDVFYTKAAFVLDSVLAIMLRIFTVLSTVLFFLYFIFFHGINYRQMDSMITYILILVAIALEIYAAVIIFSSDRMMIRLTGDGASFLRKTGLNHKFKGHIVLVVGKIVSALQHLHLVPARARWSNAIGQYNLLDCCLQRNKCTKVHQYLYKYLFWNTLSIPSGLKALIFDNLKERASSTGGKQLGSYRGDRISLTEMGCFEKSDEVEYDQSVLLWHLATELLFVIDEATYSQDNDLKLKCEMSKRLSDYIIHLLMISPFMLPSGIGQIRFQDTCAEAIELFKESQGSITKKKACEKLLGVDTRIPPSEVKGGRSKSLLFDACRLVKSLETLEVGRRWEIIIQVWLDILTFAAAQSRCNDHAEKLSQGGELLTHVWLLMAHFGMIDQFQVSQGHVRAKFY